MANQLLEQQASLLDYLSSAAVIFGGQADAALDPALQSIDRGVLRLQARFACNKRIERITAIFPRTFEILGPDQKPVLREFVEVSRPTEKSPLPNARELHNFLSARWRQTPPAPPHLPDVAACELAIAEVSDAVDDRETPAERGKSNGLKRSIRRRTSVSALRCAYDVRSIFDAGCGAVIPPKRETSLVVSFPAGRRNADIIEVPKVIADALMLLRDWTDPSRLDAFGDRHNLVSHLAAQEFIDVRA
jgi:hypothetical protein